MLHPNPTAHGGDLRRHRSGRRARPLSTRFSLHLIFKCRYPLLRTPRRFALIQNVIQVYAHRFNIRVAQVSIQKDHIHLMVRGTRRSNLQSFFRVVAGQIPQRLEKKGLFTPALQRRRVTDTPTWVKVKFWLQRPFTRIVAGSRDFKNVRDYIRLNELEALGVLKYRKTRLKGLSPAERQKILWGFG